MEAARAWVPELGKTALDLKKPTRKKLRGRRDTPNSKDPNQAHRRRISTRGAAFKL